LIIAIAATSPNIDDQVAMQGARAAYYLFYDTGSDQYEVVPNPAAQADRGAGPVAASFLVNQGVDMVVSGEFGPKFRAELEHSGVVCKVLHGKITKVINELG
jgi:predicted Fe-Mo cluster-binding NifX family protein